MENIHEECGVFGYYSETENAGFWHYGADGKPVLW